MFGSEAPVPRFVQAFGRARRIAHDAFQMSQRVVAIVACSSDTTQDLFAPAEDGLAALRDAGFNGAVIAEWKAPFWPDREEEEEAQPPAIWRVFDVTDDPAGRDVLIWCSVSYESAITPKAPALSYLADLDRGVLAYVYDDRGMDLTALERDTLLTLYRERKDWLLDYDRARIDEAFGASL